MRDELPTGTVTFLFTDVQGSTRLLQELGADAYADALAEHRRVIREACAAEGGVEVDTQGDAFFFAFPTAPGALGAARAFTGALASGPIQVRAGLHTGTPLLTDEGYVGQDVHRAARIAATGYGGQVLVSASTAQLVELELRDLGEHRFKDLAAPERVHQFGDSDFPPLRSLYRTNLPVPATPFLGREQELAEVLSLLSSEDTRLLTLTGPGGTGKTRLALHAAAEASEAFPDGIWWVPLAPLRDPALVFETAARVVGSKNGLAEHIADKSMLCLFDNFEQVVEAGTKLADLLAACPELNVLVTSRERLRIRGEQTYPVPPLAERDGIALFNARAGAVDPAFAPNEAVAELCARLDSLPLALELAAARTSVLSPKQILDRLTGRLDLLRGGRDADPRQQTLRATIEWSYELLMPEEQLLFVRLSVFAGGCTLQAAEEVADADLDTLQPLVEKSLLRFTDERYWMLQTIREYAAERLGDDDRGLRRRYAEYVLAMAVRAEPELRGPTQAEWLRVLEQEVDNIRAALTWALAEGEYEFALRLASALERFWPAHGRAAEALTWFERMLDGCAFEALPSTRARALWVAGWQAGQLHRTARAQALLEEAEPLLRRSGDGDALVFCLCELAGIHGRIGNAAEATRLAEDALATARQLGPRPVSAALDTLADDAARHGNHVRALTLREEALSLRRGLDDPTVVIGSLYGVALTALALEDEERARAAFAESLTLARDLDNRVQIAASAANLGYLELFRGNSGEARSLLHEGLKLFSDMGNDVYAADCVSGVAAIAVDEGRHSLAVQLWEAIDAFLVHAHEKLDDIDALARSRFEPTARAALSLEQRSTAAQDGAQMHLNDAIKLALEMSTTPAERDPGCRQAQGNEQ